MFGNVKSEIKQDKRDGVCNTVKVGALHAVRGVNARTYERAGDVIAAVPHGANIRAVKGVKVNGKGKLRRLCKIYKT